MSRRPEPQYNKPFPQQYLPYAAEDLFYQLVNFLYEIGEINFENLFVDGTKIEANANKYSYVWKKSTNKYQVKLAKKIRDFIELINSGYGYSFTEETPLDEIYSKLIKQSNGRKICIRKRQAQKRNTAAN